MAQLLSPEALGFLQTLTYNDDPNSPLCKQCPHRYGFPDCVEINHDVWADAANVRVSQGLLRILIDSDPNNPEPVCVHPDLLDEHETYRVELQKQDNL
jgi:hypothetical protein